MREFLKKWWLVLLGIIASFLAFGQKPKWVKEVEGNIKEREKEISKVKTEREQVKQEADKLKDSLPDFDKVVKEQDEKIAEAGKVEEVKNDTKPITSPSDIADFIHDRIGKRD